MPEQRTSHRIERACKADGADEDQAERPDDVEIEPTLGDECQAELCMGEEGDNPAVEELGDCVRRGRESVGQAAGADSRPRQRAALVCLLKGPNWR